MHKCLFYNKFIMSLHVSSTIVLIIRRSKLYYKASGIVTLKQMSGLKLLKKQFCKYDHIVLKFMYEFFGCDYCILLTINMLCHVEVMLSSY